MLIQACAYDGQFTRCLEVFADMLTAPAGVANDGVPKAVQRMRNCLSGVSPNGPFRDGVRHEAEPEPTFQPNMTSFRAIFIGFFRHTQTPSQPPRPSSASLTKQPPDAHFSNPRLSSYSWSSSSPSSPAFSSTSQEDWNLSNLELLFQSFLALPKGIHLRAPVVYWILMAFSKASGHDLEVMEGVIRRLEERFYIPWGGGRLWRIRDRVRNSDDGRKASRWQDVE